MENCVRLEAGREQMEREKKGRKIGSGEDQGQERPCIGHLSRFIPWPKSSCRSLGGFLSAVMYTGTGLHQFNCLFVPSSYCSYRLSV